MLWLHMTGLTIRFLTTADAPAVGALLTASHRDYPAFRLEFPDPNIRGRVLLPFQTAAARDVARHGKAFGAYLDDQLAGVALWQPPGQFPISVLRKARMTPALLRVAVADPRAFPRFAASGAALERTIPATPVWFLQALGVHPIAQRRGIGAALLADDIARLTRTTCPATCTPPIPPISSNTSGGASSSPSPGFLPAAADRRTTE